MRGTPPSPAQCTPTPRASHSVPPVGSARMGPPRFPSEAGAGAGPEDGQGFGVCLPLPGDTGGPRCAPGALTWFAAGSLRDGGQGPAGPAGAAGRQGRRYRGRSGSLGCPGTAGRCSEPGCVLRNVRHPLPAPSALPAPFSSQPWHHWAVFSGAGGISHPSVSPLGHFPPRSQPQNPPSATPSPRRGPPAPLPEGQGRGSSLSLHPGGAVRGPRAVLSPQRDPSCLIQSSGRAVKAARQHLGRAGPGSGGVPGVGGTLDPHLCLLCPLRSQG